jgi:hypothetical protein
MTLYRLICKLHSKVTEEFTPPPLPEVELTQVQEADPDINPKQGGDVSKVEDGVSEANGMYVQTPTPLLGKGQRLTPEQTAQVDPVVPTPTGEGFDPLPSDLPKFNETWIK